MKPTKKYASSTDVARLAEVSQSAVSRTFGGGRVSPETRAKVLAAAAQLNYRPSALPQIMLTERSRLVAVVVGGMYNPFYAEVLEIFGRRLQETGHQILLFRADSSYTLDSAIPLLAGYRVDAVVSALAVLSDEAARELSTFNVPIVSFNTTVVSDHISAVCCDNAGGGAKIAELFLARGARRCAYVAGPADSPASNDRFAGFAGALAAAGATPPRRVAGDFTYEAGWRGAIELFGGADAPDAVFCANDLVAFGVIDAIRDRFGLDSPGDVLVAGFDDIPAAAWKGYDLTSVDQNAEAMVGASLAIIDADGGGRRGSLEVLPARVVERGTTAGLRQAHRG